MYPARTPPPLSSSTPSNLALVKRPKHMRGGGEGAVCACAFEPAGLFCRAVCAGVATTGSGRVCARRPTESPQRFARTSPHHPRPMCMLARAHKQAPLRTPTPSPPHPPPHARTHPLARAPPAPSLHACSGDLELRLAAVDAVFKEQYSKVYGTSLPNSALRARARQYSVLWVEHGVGTEVQQALKYLPPHALCELLMEQYRWGCSRRLVGSQS